MIRATPPTDGHRAGMIVLAAMLALAWKPVAAQDARQPPPAPLANPASETVPPPVPGAGNLPNTGNIRPRPGLLTPQRNGRAVGPAAGAAAAPGRPLSLLPPPLPAPDAPLAPGDAAPPAPLTTAVSPAPPLPPGIPAPAARSVPSRSAPGGPLPPCPRRLLVRLLAGATAPEDAAAALAIEAEALELCTERQKLIVELHEADGKLREAWNKGKKKAGEERNETEAGPETETETGPVPPPPLVLSETPATPPPVLPAPPATRPATPPGVAATAAPASAPGLGPIRLGGPDPVVEAAPAREPSLRYAWFSILGTPGALRAGITDGTRLWYVGEGDRLPGGARVGHIAARPPGVALAGRTGTALPHGAPPPVPANGHEETAP